MDNTPDILVTIIPLVEVLEELGVLSYIDGSVASSIYGLPRLTIDIDIIAASIRNTFDLWYYDFKQITTLTRT